MRLETVPATVIDPGMVLRRALIAWGLGHLVLGDARGWLLLALEIAWLIVFGVSLALLATDHWLISYALLAGFIVTWIGQAVAAYREARRRSGRNTGAAWLLTVAPVVIALLTGFWLFSGAQASPAATFQRYVGAWRRADTATASGLFAHAQDPAALRAQWSEEESLVADQIAALEDAHPDFGLDEDNPDSNLRFDPHDPGSDDTDPGSGPVQFDVHVVRQVTVPSTFFGLVPASRTETRVIESLGTATLVRQAVGGALAPIGASVWVIQSVEFAVTP